MACVIGVDLGTQSIKGVVCDGHLRVIAEHAIPHASDHPLQWQTDVGKVLTILRNGRDVKAIAIAGQLDGCVAVEDQMRPARTWKDRSAPMPPLDAARVYALTGQVADPIHLAAKARASPYARMYHEPTSWLVRALTGADVIDPSLASTTLLCADNAWHPELLAAFDLRAAQLPTIAHSTIIAGEWTGIPVAVGTGDDFATPLGAGLVDPGRLACVLGTAEVVGAIWPLDVRDPAPEPMVECHPYPSGGYFVENPGWMSGGVIRWACRLLGVTEQQLDAMAAPDSAGLVFIPALAGLMAPVWRPDARGQLVGLTDAHDRGHIARAILEGLAFACRQVAERIDSLAPISEVALLGGGSRSRVWAQLRADAPQLPHRVAPRTDTCAVGAAMIAAVAAGWFPDLRAAATCAPPLGPPVEPRGNLDAAYGRYREAIDRLLR